MGSVFAYCGLDCSQCPAYKATVTNDEKALSALLGEWNSPEYPLAKEDLLCDGCKSSSKRLFKFCRECSIRQCASSRGLTTCADCEEYPCGSLDQLPPESRESLENLRQRPE